MAQMASLEKAVRLPFRLEEALKDEKDGDPKDDFVVVVFVDRAMLLGAVLFPTIHPAAAKLVDPASLSFA